MKVVEEVKSVWFNDELVWIIDGPEGYVAVSDGNLKSWVNQNMSTTDGIHDGIVRHKHTRAYYHSETTKRSDS